MKNIILSLLFIISTNSIAETIDEKRHRTSPYARGLSSASKNQISREQYTLIANSMAGNYKDDLDNEGRELFFQQVAQDNECKITSVGNEQGKIYLITCL